MKEQAHSKKSYYRPMDEYGHEGGGYYNSEGMHDNNPKKEKHYDNPYGTHESHDGEGY